MGVNLSFHTQPAAVGQHANVFMSSVPVFLPP
jgi:hypothetical protein